MAQVHSDFVGEYMQDAWRRSILFLDVLRQRGNAFLEREDNPMRHVLSFDFDLVLDGHDLPKPVNYWMARVRPPATAPTPDPRQRPFIVIDPRAGHGPGIGGFKADSEIGVAMQAGHPCYFVGFRPIPSRDRRSRTWCAPSSPSPRRSAAAIRRPRASRWRSAIARPAGRC